VIETLQRNDNVRPTVDLRPKALGAGAKPVAKPTKVKAKTTEKFMVDQMMRKYAEDTATPVDKVTIDLNERSR